jgi:hypothetical protein
LDSSARQFARGRGGDVVDSDPLALRGRQGDRDRGLDPVEELERLNRAFVDNRRRVVPVYEREGRLRGGPPPGSGVDAIAWGYENDDEPYHWRAFEADSLRPPGLEDLNGPGPLWALQPVGATVPEGSRAAGESYEPAVGRRETQTPAGVNPTPGVDPDDQAWGAADPNRTPEQALAEFWGEEYAESALGRQRLRRGVPYGEHCAAERAANDSQGRGNACGSAGCRRFNRWQGIPFWQVHGERPHEPVSNDTLGQAPVEVGTQTRGWDMERFRRGRPGPLEIMAMSEGTPRARQRIRDHRFDGGAARRMGPRDLEMI